MKKVTLLFNKIQSHKKGQIFLVCTVIIIIYLLSFITIIYELNVTQFTERTEITEFQAAYENFKTETNSFMNGLLANYSDPATIIVSNVIAGQLLNGWLDFATQRFLAQGFFAVFEINEIVPVTTPIRLISGNGFLSLEANIDVYLECNYMSIDTELQYYYRYSLSYNNLVTSALIEFTVESLIETSYIGYADVTVNALSCTNLFNGSYLSSALLVAGDVIQAITTDQIIVNLTV